LKPTHKKHSLFYNLGTVFVRYHVSIALMQLIQEMNTHDVIVGIGVLSCDESFACSEYRRCK